MIETEIDKETYYAFKEKIYEQIYETNKHLLQRIDKAIEYIKSKEYWYSQVKSEEKLLEILGDKENERT